MFVEKIFEVIFLAGAYFCESLEKSQTSQILAELHARAKRARGRSPIAK